MTNDERFVVPLYLPAQAAAETEAAITVWHVDEGQSFSTGQVLAEAESAKSTFPLEAPCDGVLVKILAAQGATVSFETPVCEISTSDASVKKAMPPIVKEASVSTATGGKKWARPARHLGESSSPVYILGIGGYLPKRVVPTRELLQAFPDLTEDYIFGVTGIRERRWAEADEKPSQMAFCAAQEAIRKSGLKSAEIDAVIVSTTTPDTLMPATACFVAGKLGLQGIPAFDLNGACSGWLYAISVAKGLIRSGIAQNVLVAAVDMQSRILDKTDRVTYFLFGDGAGATVVSGKLEGHLICEEALAADPQGLHMARRSFPGYEVPAQCPQADPWLRLDGHALFRYATESFSSILKKVIERSGWQPQDVRWVVPHQANSRIIRAAARRSGVPFERFYLNIDRVGNTSSASIPLALVEIDNYLQRNDKVVLCSVGAGITYAAISLKW